jgi:hypothetical protein
MAATIKAKDLARKFLVIASHQNHLIGYFPVQHQDLKACLQLLCSSLGVHIDSIHNPRERDDLLNNYQIGPDE